MNNQIYEQIFVGAVVALIAAIINRLFTVKINYLLVVGGFVVAAVLYGIYITQVAPLPFTTIVEILVGILLVAFLCRAYLEGFGQVPFQKWRVGLMTDPSRGEIIDEAWRFKGTSVYGPYIRLGIGKYRATFKIKVDNLRGGDQPIAQIDVVSNHRYRGDTTLSSRILTTRDFKRADKYEFFSLTFDVHSHEHDMEFRVNQPPNTEPTVTITLDYIQLSRRWF